MLFPIGDDNARLQRRRMIMPMIVGVCAGMWYLQLTRGEAFTMGWSAVPAEITTGHDLTGPASIATPHGSVVIHHAPGPWPIWWTLLSSQFMHGSWGHLLGNMLYLVIFGDQIEDRLGRLRFLLFYVVCGVAAGLSQVFGDPGSLVPTLGASGAIAGVLGAYLVTTPRNRVHVLFLIKVFTLPAWLVLSAWFGLQIWSLRSMPPGQASGVAYLAHIGGFLAGVLLIWPLTPRRR